MSLSQPLRQLACRRALVLGAWIHWNWRAFCAAGELGVLRRRDGRPGAEVTPRAVVPAEAPRRAVRYEAGPATRLCIRDKQVGEFARTVNAQAGSQFSAIVAAVATVAICHDRCAGVQARHHDCVRCR